MSNHVLIRFIRFVSRFIVHFYNTIYFSTTFSTPCKRFTKFLRFAFTASKHGLKWMYSKFWIFDQHAFSSLIIGADQIQVGSMTLESTQKYVAKYELCESLWSHGEEHLTAATIVCFFRKTIVWISPYDHAHIYARMDWISNIVAMIGVAFYISKYAVV